MNINHSPYRIFLFILIYFFHNSAKGQVIADGGLKSTLLAIENTGKNLPVEKLYLQFDKPYYSIGDTIHFKSYLLNADFLTLSNHSGLIYVELDDKNNKSVKRIMVPTAAGIGWADLALSEKDIPEGDYTLRAYTNWTRNFGEDYVFKKNFYISAATGQSILVNTGFKLTNNNLQANLQFINLDKQPLSGKLQLQVTDEKKNIYKTIATVSADGRADINFALPDKADLKHLYIIATEVSVGSSNRSAVIPVNISRPENTDIKFIPEGGTFVAGLPAHIGFEVTGEDSRGLDAAGTIYNSKQQQVATFRSVHNGIGSFTFTPETGESYTAKLTSQGGVVKSYALPAISPSGTTLIINARGNDSLTLMLRAANMTNAAANYYLIAQARGVMCYAALLSFNGGVIKRTLSKELFPTGITRFTLMDASRQPLNERLVYIDHQDNLRLNINSNKTAYSLRDSVALNLQVSDKTGKPANGTFSASVTDNNQVKPDTTGTNMLNYLLLTSDLKQEIEDPGYYFTKNGQAKAEALDNLLLMQAPAGLSWKDVFDTKSQPPAYTAEKEFSVQGRVTNLFNKGVANSDVMLFSQKPSLFLGTKTDDNGQFIFKGFLPADSAVFLIQAKNKRGNSNNVGVEMNEFKPPIFTTTPERQIPWYVNTDTVLLNNTLTQIAQQQNAAGLKGKQLKEVTIKDTKIIKDSKNLNGPGESDQSLNKEDMEKAGKLTLRQLLEQKIKGFTEGQVAYPPDNLGHKHPGDPKYRISYKINEKEIRFVFDGMDLSYFYYAPDDFPSPATGRGGRRSPDIFNSLSYDWKRYVDTYLDYYTAEDITGIEVMYNSRYNNNYINKNLSITETISNNVNEKYAYIEITTRSGQGPFMKKTAGTYLYKPVPMSLPKKFYSPRYTAKNNDLSIGTDLRSTIFWAPNIVTDQSGKAPFSFYSADKPGTYTITIEGIDLNGEPGYKREKIKITPK
ncbi:MAG: hypothetical protein JWQ79_2725 [Mucilaginibacter sp.]|nr:hypothetical protein [Mucilaginibacter sp.]